jgi:hypothetical protein
MKNSGEIESSQNVIIRLTGPTVHLENLLHARLYKTITSNRDCDAYPEE